MPAVCGARWSTALTSSGKLRHGADRLCAGEGATRKVQVDRLRVTPTPTPRGVGCRVASRSHERHGERFSTTTRAECGQKRYPTAFRITRVAALWTGRRVAQRQPDQGADAARRSGEKRHEPTALRHRWLDHDGNLDACGVRGTIAPTETVRARRGRGPHPPTEAVIASTAAPTPASTVLSSPTSRSPAPPSL